MRIRFLLLTLLIFGCADDNNKDPLQSALASESDKITKVMDNLDLFEVQIKLSTIARIKDSVVFKDYTFQVNDSLYFYPASTVKFPGAVLALEKFYHLQKDYTIDTPFYVEGDSTMTTFRKEIEDIFAVSSNDTYNRIFEFLGKDYMNDRLEELGLTPLRLSHRLSTDNAYDLTTKPLVFLEDDSLLTTTNPIINKPIIPLELKKINKGVGYYANDELVNEPMDFSLKNYLPISTIHDMMKRVMFPNSFPMEQRFKINKDDYEFLVKTMAILPKDVGYDVNEYFDGYGKFFMYGDTKKSIPNHIKIHNKVGYAYGYLTDCAYIVDSKQDLEYILTATIHVNEDGIFNDNIYEYDSIGLPFLSQLGKEIHRILSDQ